MALAFDGTTIWTVGVADHAVAQFTPDGRGTVVHTLPQQPQAIAAVTTPSGARRAFIATADGHLFILDETGGEVVLGGFDTQVNDPRSVAINGDVLVIAGLPITRLFRIDPITGSVTADETVSVPSRGAAAGAGADLWIAFEPDRLVRYDGMTETTEAYEVPATPHKVLYDGDRVYVISRPASLLSVVRIQQPG
jgi:sugar lactone lactonase YvrE